LDTYLDGLQQFPENADTLQVAKGTALLVKKDIFKNLMWYVLPDSNKQYPLLIERVKQIKNLNKQNIIPEDLGAVEVNGKPKEELVNVDLTGQFSIKALDNADRKKRQNQRPSSPQQRRNDHRPPNNRPPNNRPDNRPPQGPPRKK
jgi:hypothetical protein